MQNPLSVGPVRLLGFAIRAVLLLVLFGSQPLAGWASNLPPSPAADLAFAAADNWHSLASRVGLDLPYARIRDGFRSVQAARFGASVPQD